MTDLTAKFNQIKHTYTGRELLQELLRDNMPVPGKVSQYFIGTLLFMFDLRQASVSSFSICYLLRVFTKTYNYDSDVLCEALFTESLVNGLSFMFYAMYKNFLDAINIKPICYIFDLTEKYNNCGFQFTHILISIKQHFTPGKNLTLIIGEVTINVYMNTQSINADMPANTQSSLYYQISHNGTIIYFGKVADVKQKLMFLHFINGRKHINIEYADIYKKYKMLFMSMTCFIACDQITTNILQENVCCTLKYENLAKKYVVNTLTYVLCNSLNVPDISYVMSPILVLKTPIIKDRQLVFGVNRATFMLVIYGLETKQEYINYIKRCFPNLFILIILEATTAISIGELVAKSKFICFHDVVIADCLTKYSKLMLSMTAQECALNNAIIIKKILLSYYKSKIARPSCRSITPLATKPSCRPYYVGGVNRLSRPPSN
jgi:hypothetical protein